MMGDVPIVLAVRQEALDVMKIVTKSEERMELQTCTIIRESNIFSVICESVSPSDIVLQLYGIDTFCTTYKVEFVEIGQYRQVVAKDLFSKLLSHFANNTTLTRER